MKNSRILPLLTLSFISTIFISGCSKTEVSGVRNYPLYGSSGGRQIVVDVSIGLTGYGIEGLDDFDTILSQYDDALESKMALSLASMPPYEDRDLLKEGVKNTLDTTLSTLDTRIFDKLEVTSISLPYVDFVEDGAKRSIVKFKEGFPGMYSGSSCDGTDGGGGSAPDGDITCTLSLANPLPGQSQFVSGQFDIRGSGGKLDTSSAVVVPQYQQQQF